MPYHFGLVRRGAPTKKWALRKVSQRLHEIAEEHDAEWSGVVNILGNDAIGWFSCQNRGEPFDSRTQREVCDAIKTAGLGWIWES